MQQVNQAPYFFIFISIMALINGMVSFKYWRKGYGTVVLNSGWRKIKKYQLKTFLRFFVFIPPKEANSFERLTLLGSAIGGFVVGSLALAIALNMMSLL